MLRRLLPAQETWVVPFVLQFAGEYVLGLVELLRAHLRHGVPEHYQAFVAENPEFLELTRQRATSYWDCYHRGAYPKKADYPGLVIVDLLRGTGGARRL